MKTPRLVLLFATLSLIGTTGLHAQARGNLREAIQRVVTRAPLNATATVSRVTPQGTVTVTTGNTFNGTSGSFATTVTLPNSNTTSVAGTISVTPGTGATITGAVTGPGGQSTSFTNTIAPTTGGFTVTSTVTPPSGNTVTMTHTLTPPDDQEDFEDGMMARLLKRLRLPVPPRG